MGRINLAMKATFNSRIDMSATMPCSMQIIPPRQENRDFIASMEITLRSMVLDTRHPITLELAGSAKKASLLIRATTQTALDHVEALLRTEYPRIGIRHLQEKEDPFHLDLHEAVSAVELIPEEDKAFYSSGHLFKEERDPLQGLLTVLGQLPNQMRAIVQIGLVPLTGSITTRKLSSNTRVLGNTGKLSISGRLESKFRGYIPVVLAFLPSHRNITLVAIANALVLVILSLLASPWFPGWLWDHIVEFILWGQFPPLTSAEIQQLIWWAVAFLFMEALFLYGAVKVIQRFPPQVPPSQSQALELVRDPRDQVRDQAPVIDIKSVYRTRIIFYVIGPKSPDGLYSHLVSFLPHFSSKSEREREEILLRIMATFRQFHAISGIAFVAKPISSRSAQLLLSREIGKLGHGWHQGLLQSNNFVSFHVLAVLWHLPRDRTAPYITNNRKITSTRVVPLPSEIINQMTLDGPIGYSEHRGSPIPFHFPNSFFSHHTLIAGKSGDGRNVFMRRLGYAAMARGDGLLLVDPYGDLCEDVLKIVPHDRVEDVVLLDLSDRMASIGLNPLDVTLGCGCEKTISDLLKVLAHIWVSSWNAKIENVFEMGLRTLFEANKILVDRDAQEGSRRQYTLLDVLPLLTNAKFGRSVLQQIQDDGYLHRWWRGYYEPLSFAQQREVITPLTTKIAKFESTSARRIIGQGASTFNIPQMIAERKIILLKLAKRIVGGDIASLVGATVLGLVQFTLEEQDFKVAGRGDQFHLPIIIDEFEALLGTDYEALAALQKRGLTFFLSCQSLEYIQKLNPLLLSAMQAHVKQLIAFHMSAQDAEMLHKELGVEQDDLIHLDLHSCYVSILAANRRQPTFALRVVAPAKVETTSAESIRTRCRVRYAYPVDQVDEMALSRPLSPVWKWKTDT
jgi:hypothetical protein